MTLRLQTFDYLFAYVYAIPHSQAFFLFLPPSAHRIRRRRFQFWRGSLSRQRSAAAWPGQSCMKRSQSIETASGDPTSRIFFFAPLSTWGRFPHCQLQRVGSTRYGGISADSSTLACAWLHRGADPRVVRQPKQSSHCTPSRPSSLSLSIFIFS